MTSRDDQTKPLGATQRVRVVNRRGLHARAAARFVKLASEFDADVRVTHADVTVAGTSIMGLLTLAAGVGSELVLTAEGEDAESAIVSLSSLVAMGFGEEPERGGCG